MGSTRRMLRGWAIKWISIGIGLRMEVGIGVSVGLGMGMVMSMGIGGHEKVQGPEYLGGHWG